ncbi:hypothetical protein [Pedococcus soli]
MAQGWVTRAGVRLRRAVFDWPETWRGFLAQSLTALVLFYALADLVGWYDLRHEPGPPVVLAVGLFGVQVVGFRRHRRRRERSLERPVHDERGD